MASLRSMLNEASFTTASTASLSCIGDTLGACFRANPSSFWITSEAWANPSSIMSRYSRVCSVFSRSLRIA